MFSHIISYLYMTWTFYCGLSFVKCALRSLIGFAPVIFQTKDGDVVPFLWAADKFSGINPDDPVDENGFNSKSYRMFVTAGALMNFILPVLLFSGIFFVEGMPKVMDEPL